MSQEHRHLSFDRPRAWIPYCDLQARLAAGACLATEKSAFEVSGHPDRAAGMAGRAEPVERPAARCVAAQPSPETSPHKDRQHPAAEVTP